MKKGLLLIFISLTGHISFAQTTELRKLDSICGHKVYYDRNGKILSWYDPAVPGAGYDKVIRLASEFIKNVPVEPNTGEKMYLVTCCFHGAEKDESEKAVEGLVPEFWAHNPACVYSGAVQSLAAGYRVYTGNNSYLNIVKGMLDYQLEHGTTPGDFEWAKVPYASADPFDTEYRGATHWEKDGMRGDGLHGIEPDKIGELGYGYLLFYEITEDGKYLDAAVNCADALAEHVQDVINDKSPFATTDTRHSPWPFRVNARNGIVISDYCSNVIEPIKLFDELLRIRLRIKLSIESTEQYKKARQLAWDWLYSRNGPIITGVWNGYFEDIPDDPNQAIRVQITPMETAKYLIRHPDLDPDLDKNVPALIHWVNSAFRTEGMDAIKEQTWCYEPMGSHTSRYGSACALWYAYSGDKWYKEQARRYLNFASYMTRDNGIVSVGPNWPGSWFSDGYSDYIRHFLDGLAAVPEWAPPGEDHLLYSSSMVQQIEYRPDRLSVVTFDNDGSMRLRLNRKPQSVEVNNVRLTKGEGADEYTWENLKPGGILRLRFKGGNRIVIKK